jgi:chromosome partitioning protein
MSARIIAVINQKGGVGKTTTTMNIAAYLAKFGYKVLVVDIDPQGNATSGLGFSIRDVKTSVYDVLIDEATGFNDVVLPHGAINKLYIAPVNLQLAGANVELVNTTRREFRLQDNLKRISDDYDFIIIDNPPSLGLLTVNGMVGATELLIPVQAEYYALEGLGQLLYTINLIQQNLNPSLNILGAVVTMYDPRTRLAEAVVKELQNYFPRRVFSTIIPRSVRLAEAPSYGQTILEYDANSRGAFAYEQLTKEIIS